MSGPPLNGNNSRLRRKIIQDEPVSARKQKNLSIKKAEQLSLLHKSPYLKHGGHVQDGACIEILSVFDLDTNMEFSVSVILKKRAEERTSEENELLFQSGEIAKEAASRLEKRELLKQRGKEFEDSEECIDKKCAQLAVAIRQAEYFVVYTGAGISTAARIPDYRGTSGVWTLLQQGKDIGEHDLTQAEPTFTHMALAEMYHQGKLKHIVSQNCDGLHLRSGLPRTALSEVHGNMYIEVCRSCRPFREYLRLFDVTESTARFNHRTQRRCYQCDSPLTDSIVHFGERGNLPWPLNWKGACKAAENADVILCLGSSLKVLKRYPWLWCMDKPAKRRPKLYIVNLQWTPKDCHAVLKIHGRCDKVMNKLVKHLGVEVPEYDRVTDPIFVHATPLCADEQHTTTRHCLRPAATAANQDLIVITVESDPKACCERSRGEESSHDESCSNYVDAARDIPVIVAPDAADTSEDVAAASTPFSSLIEAMFFNYLYTLIASLTSYQLPAPSAVTGGAPIASTSKTDESDTDDDDDDLPLIKRFKIGPPITAKCSFCTEQYRAETCLFYVKRDAAFKPNAPACLCCGGDDDDEDNNDDDEPAPAAENSENGADKEEKLKTPINPGWFGKGCRKKIKKKR